MFRKRSYSVPGPPQKWYRQGFHTQAHLPTAGSADSMWPGCPWICDSSILSGLSKSIRRVLAPLAIQVTFRPFRTPRQELVHPKDPVLANHRKGVVYSIPCAECPRTYIGQMGRTLDHRLHERWALKYGDLESSALAEDVFSSNYRVDLSKAKVIDTHIHTHTHTQTRCMLESWHIQHHQPPPLSREKGTLPGLYAALLI